LDDAKNLMNKMMKKYIEQVRAEPTLYIREKTKMQKFTGGHAGDPERMVMFEDGMFPSFSNSLLYGLDWDFLMLEVLVIACMDAAQNKYFDLPANKIVNGISFGVLIAFICD
jgi:hypothetical protein